MNRHIYGLTLFLVIVKIHFLLYWALFAPINFFSTRENPVDRPAIFELENAPVSSCDSSKVEIRYIELDAKNGKLFGSAKVTGSKPNTFAKTGKMQVQLMTENSFPVWSGEVEYKITNSCFTGRSAEFEESIPELKNLNLNSNYYAHARILTDGISGAEKAVYKINKTTPVLIVNRK